jgi:ADP-heptose:LPS heptosyltransferase
MENILIVRLKSIGDILFTLPAVHVVRQNFPSARIHFLVSKEHAPLLRGFSEVDEVIPLDRAVYSAKGMLPACAGTLQLLQRLRRPKFSLAIDFQGYGETELLTWSSGAAERWGSVYRKPRGWTYTRGVQRDNSLQIADWNLSLLRQCGLRIGEIRNEYNLPGEAVDEARRFFIANRLDPAKPTLFLQPFTSSPQKDWPLERFLELAGYWRLHQMQIIFGGGPSESARLQPARDAGYPVAAGAPLLVSAGLVKLSTLVVGADTGLLHLAVALGRRVVMLIQSGKRCSSYPFQHTDWTISPSVGKNVSAISTTSMIAATSGLLSDQRTSL